MNRTERKIIRDIRRRLAGEGNFPPDVINDPGLRSYLESYILPTLDRLADPERTRAELAAAELRTRLERPIRAEW